MTMLVTGCAGYLGNVLCRKLLNRGDQVICFDNIYKGHCDSLLDIASHPNFEFIYGNVTKLSDCITAIQKCDAIFHLAGIVGFPRCAREPELSYLVNVKGTQNIILARNEVNNNIPIVYSSTGSIYGRIEGLCTEDSPRNPQSEYGVHKHQAEELIRNIRRTVSLRFATCFGCSSNMRNNLLINELVFQAIHNRCFTVFEPDARRTFIHIQDLCDSFIYFLDHIDSLKYNVYNCGHPDLNWTKRQVAEYIKDKTGCVVSYQEFAKDLDQRDYTVCYDRMLNEGFKPKITMQIGIDELIKVIPLLRNRNPYD